MGDGRGKGTFGRFIVGVTLGEEEIVACPGDRDNTAYHFPFPEANFDSLYFLTPVDIIQLF